MSALHVERVGDGPNLVLLHGWGMHGGIWEGVRELLAQSFCLHIVDLPGYGASAGIAPYTLQTLARAVAAEIPQHALVCGWSLGGQVAMQLALESPQCVDRLVLISSTPCFRQRDDWMPAMEDATLQEFALSLERDYVGTLKRFLSLQARSGDAARDVIAALRAKLFTRGEPSLQTLRDGLGILRDVDLRAMAPRILQPTLIVHGERDTLTPLGAGEWLSKVLPQARLAQIQGSAHAPFLSHPDATLSVLEAFLRG